MPTTRKARVELTADPRPLERGIKRSKSALDSFKASVGRSLGFIGGALKDAAKWGSLGVGALFGIEAVKAARYSEAMSRLQIATGQTGGQMAELAGSMRKISESTGVAKEDLLSATAGFVALTGDANAARASMELFAKVQKGTGAAMEDISTTAAALKQNLQINDSDLEKSFSILIRGGKAGAIEMKELAGLLAQIAPLGAQFAGGTGTRGLADLAAALQLARQGFGSASQAATGLEALMGSIVRGSAKLKAGGVSVFNVDSKGVRRLKSFQEIIGDIANSKLANNPKLLVDAFGSKEAYAAFLQLTKVKGAWAGLSGETLKANDVAEDYAAFQQSSAGQMQLAMNELRATVSDIFTPERIQMFAQALKWAVDQAGDLAARLGDAYQWMREIAGGGKSDVTKMEESDTLDDALTKHGMSLEEIAAGPGQGAFFSMMGRSMAMNDVGKRWQAAGLVGERGDAAREIAKRRLQENARVKREARKKVEGEMSYYGAPALGMGHFAGVTAEAEESLAAERARAASEALASVSRDEPRARGGRRPDTVRHVLVLDPANSQIDIAGGNGRGHTVRP